MIDAGQAAHKFAPQYLAERQEALDVGFADGRKTRNYRDNDHEKYIEYDRDVYLESPWPRQRGKQSAYHEVWRLGFDAGYLGKARPRLPKET
jgi:hypothetical protein